ncbi:multidrug DMT transporter permease [Stenotrophomonas pictorum JCM 9942]|uniref:Multidrug DMT transporter permease n=1 Tax=Stenotrophomonas pictorum JCM 9942 TaxID=1236960 RepID=A0A0R0AFW4_9GAMM|nr:DMT family transporter [Stenotrophomonas pictorum]KRG40292.1 multidrug DMT transporter permease [Stenotrophomonas pictorum JCM 9942]
MNQRMLGGIANGVASGALWGLVFLAPAVLTDFSPLQLAASRYLVYGLIAAILLLPRWPALRAHIGKVEWKALTWLSLLGNLVYFVLLSICVQWSGGASAALIVGMVPVLVAVVGAREPGAVPLSRLAPALALCVAGVVLMGVKAMASSHVQTSPAQRLTGLLCGVGALLSWTAYSIGNTRWLAKVPAVSGHDWSLLTGVATGGLALLLAPVAFAGGGQGHSGGQWLGFWAMATAVAVFASILGNACWNRASRALPLTLGGQMIVFETLFGLVYGFVWQQRWPLPLEILAALCLVAGVIWSAAAHRPATTLAQSA